MTRLQDRAQLVMARGRLGTALIACLAGGAALGLAAWTDGHRPIAAALVGGALALALALSAAPPWAAAARTVRPQADPDGLLRAALAVAGDHPLAAHLQGQAAQRPLRAAAFRIGGEWRPLTGLAVCSLVLAFWTGTAPGFAAARGAGDRTTRLGEVATASAGSSEAALRGNGESTADRAAADPHAGSGNPADDGPVDGARTDNAGPDPAPTPSEDLSSPDPRWTPLAAPDGGLAFRPIRDPGVDPAVVERFLRLRAARRP